MQRVPRTRSSSHTNLARYLPCPSCLRRSCVCVQPAAFACPHSMETFSCAQPTCSRCPLYRKILHMRSNCRLRRQFLRLLSYSKRQVAIATLLANKAVERTITHKLEDARDAVQGKLVEILQAYKTSMTAAGAGASAQLAVSENLKMLPVLVLGLLKNVGIRQSAQIPPDLRAYAQALLTSLPSQVLVPYIHPTFYSLHNMPPEVKSYFGVVLRY